MAELTMNELISLLETLIKGSEEDQIKEEMKENSDIKLIVQLRAKRNAYKDVIDIILFNRNKKE